MRDVVQVIPQNNFTVYVYFDDGRIVLYDMKLLLNKGIFQKISSINEFMEKCTVINGTLAWDIGGNFDPYKCIDIDPEVIYENGLIVKDPCEKSA